MLHVQVNNIRAYEISPLQLSGIPISRRYHLWPVLFDCQ